MGQDSRLQLDFIEVANDCRQCVDCGDLLSDDEAENGFICTNCRLAELQAEPLDI